MEEKGKGEILEYCEKWIEKQEICSSVEAYWDSDSEDEEFLHVVLGTMNQELSVLKFEKLVGRLTEELQDVFSMEYVIGFNCGDTENDGYDSQRDGEPFHESWTNWTDPQNLDTGLSKI